MNTFEALLWCSIITAKHDPDEILSESMLAKLFLVLQKEMKIEIFGIFFDRTRHVANKKIVNEKGLINKLLYSFQDPNCPLRVNHVIQGIQVKNNVR